MKGSDEEGSREKGQGRDQHRTGSRNSDSRLTTYIVPSLPWLSQGRLWRHRRGLCYPMPAAHGVVFSLAWSAQSPSSDSGVAEAHGRAWLSRIIGAKDYKCDDPTPHPFQVVGTPVLGRQAIRCGTPLVPVGDVLAVELKPGHDTGPLIGTCRTFGDDEVAGYRGLWSIAGINSEVGVAFVISAPCHERSKLMLNGLGGRGAVKPRGESPSCS